MVSGRINTKNIINFTNRIQNIPKIIETVNKEASRVFFNMHMESYDNERSPYGIKWKNKKIPNGFRILHSSRDRLKGSIKVQRFSKRGFTLGTNVSYGKYHMTGTANMPARPFLLDKDRIPVKYKNAYMKVYKKHLLRHMRKKK